MAPSADRPFLSADRDWLHCKQPGDSSAMKADPAVLYNAQADLTGAPRVFCDTARDQYLENARWSAPARGITCRGREVVLAHLVKEAAAMRGAVGLSSRPPVPNTV